MGHNLETFGKLIERAGKAGRKPPAHHQAPSPTPASMPSPAPVPSPRSDDDDDDDDECKIRLVAPKGGDAIHNMCSDVVLKNVYSGYDIVVMGKAFDTLDADNVLYEVKTGDFRSYSKFLQERTHAEVDKAYKVDRPKAEMCGFGFQIAIADDMLYREYASKLPAGYVRHVPECRRQVKR